MFYFIWYYFWYAFIVPFFLIIVYPFCKVTVLEYLEYCIHELKIKTIIVKESERIQKGFILANHRCFFDFLWDIYISQSPILGRRLAFLVFLFQSIFLHLEYGTVVINRGKDRAESIFKKMLQYKRVLFFPEGTRMRYTSLNSPEEVKQILKYGILKQIYKHKQLPVQIQITSNKEKVIDELKMKITKGVNLKTFVTDPIYPADYETEQDFYDEIAKKWYEAWVYTHNGIADN